MDWHILAQQITDLAPMRNSDGTWSQVGMLVVAIAATCGSCGLLFRLLMKSYDTRISDLQNRCSECEADRKRMHEELSKIRDEIKKLREDRHGRLLDE